MGLAGDIILADDFDGLSDAWVAWTPTLTNLTLGNGTVTARARLVGESLDYRFKFKLGSSSAVGTNPSFTVPYTPHADYVAAEDDLGRGDLLDSGTANRAAVVRLSSGSTLLILAYSTTGAHATITSTSPWTWTTNDSLSVSGSIELA